MGTCCISFSLHPHNTYSTGYTIHHSVEKLCYNIKLNSEQTTDNFPLVPLCVHPVLPVLSVSKGVGEKKAAVVAGMSVLVSPLSFLQCCSVTASPVSRCSCSVLLPGPPPHPIQVSDLSIPLDCDRNGTH